MKRQRLQPEDYNFGWICALPVELEAATKMLDEAHNDIPQDANHSNLYTLGRISGHNIVIVCLPAGQIGTNSAAIVASHMMSKFPSIHYILMVGIGGGVPSVEADIRLGHVVVSQPHLGRSGVVQYDLGKSTPSGFVRTGFLNAPPAILLSALSTLQADSSACQRRLSQKLSEFSHGCQNIGLDLLFESTYQHIEGSTCDKCSNSRLVSRAPRAHQGPVVHHGTIASGNQVIRDGTTRDKLSSELGGVLCFEMEAAGLMNNVPCLVILGICDYADSHKNKKWHSHAAATAAVYARELLSIIPTFSEPSFKGRQAPALLKLLPTAAEAAFNSYSKQHDLLCLPNTRVDVLNEIYAWTEGEGHQCVFWLNGMAGTGKSTIARTVARRFSELGRLAGSFFFSRGGKDVHDARLLFTTIARHLADLSPILGRYISEAIAAREEIASQTFGDQWTQLIVGPLSKLSGRMVQQSLIIVLDALDECEGNDDIRLLIRLLSETNSTSAVRLRVLVTSRPESAIRHGFRSMPESLHHDLILDAISQEVVDHDIAAFLEVKFNEMRESFAYLPIDWPGTETIDSLVRNAGGLFIYAATVCRFILTNKKWSPQRLLNLFTAQHTPSLSKGNSRKLPSLSPTAELDMMYLQILKHSMQGIEDYDDRAELADEFKQVVGAIAILPEPLSPTALGRLLDVDQETIHILIEGLRSVVSVPDDPILPLRLLHSSFRDFLIDENRCNDPLFCLDEKEAHRTLTESCLQRLESPTGLKKDICSLKQHDSLAADLDKSTVLQSLPSHIQYACLYWAHHLKNIGQDLSEGGHPHLFLQHHFLHWLEALSVIGKLVNGVHAIDLLESMVDDGSSPHLYSFIRDARRFLLYNRSTIEKAPLQAYCSALIFAPQKSLVRKHFVSEIPRWIRRMPEVEQEWSSLLQTLEGHSGRIRTIVFSSDGQLLASAGYDRKVVIWDTKTGAFCSRLEGHSDCILTAVFSPDGKSLATGSADRTSRIWDVGTRKPLVVLNGHTASIYSVDFSPSGLLLASASGDTTIRLWGTKTWQIRAILSGHEESVRTLKFSPNGELIASAAKDGVIRIWDPQNGQCVHSFRAQLEITPSLAFSLDSQVLFSAYPYEIMQWEVKRWTCLRSVETSGKHLGFTLDGRYAASYTESSKICIHDVLTGIRCGAYEIHRADISIIAFSPVQKLLASASYGASIELWDTTVEGCLETHRSHSARVEAVSFSPNGKKFASVSFDATAKIWDMSTGECQRTLAGHSSVGGLVFFSPDGHLFVTDLRDNVKIWNPENRECHATVKPNFSATVIVCSTDGLLLACSSKSQNVNIWDLGSSTLLSTLEGHLDIVYSLAFSPDGHTLASGSYNKTIIWDAHLGTSRIILAGRGGYVYCLAFSTDSKFLASSSEYGVTLWNIHTSEQILTLEVRNIDQISFFRGGLYILKEDKILALKYACHLPVEKEEEEEEEEEEEHDDDEDSLQSRATNRWKNAKLFTVLEFPSEYRGRYAVNGNVIGMGLESGRVTFMEVDLDNVPLGAATLGID
ncbi:hypothetical protein LTR84_011994 [Exophiala bonariae]|uniref:NACHT domain-containing protein n=1 Tax=Exophiala bonariae TaxID=1690606 RepID=A0AAV9MS09_9EURO|nr:hypothetical protein LTR84_011994 [Exophiala bonariae]